MRFNGRTGGHMVGKSLVAAPLWAVGIKISLTVFLNHIEILKHPILLQQGFDGYMPSQPDACHFRIKLDSRLRGNDMRGTNVEEILISGLQQNLCIENRLYFPCSMEKTGSFIS